MNRTLFDCGLRKSVELKDGRLYDVTSTLEKTVKLSSATVKCKHHQTTRPQDRSKVNNIWTAMYNSSTQPLPHRSSNSNSSAARNTSTIFVHINNHSGETNTQRMAESQQLEDVSRESAGVTQGQTQRRSNSRRGSNKRKSYTVDFKTKTLDLLDSLKSSTNKYNTVAKQQGVNRSLVFKWEKNRSKILAELTLNKTKKNTGGARSMRQRRRIAGNRSQRTDKYPLASNLLLAKFKLQRAAGSKVSKLWLKKKRMKSKIEACYGAEEAAKFKGSSN